MGFVTDFVEGIFGGNSDAKEATKEAAETSVGAQREALDYLKQRERIPQKFRESALKELGGLYGLKGGKGSQK